MSDPLAMLDAVVSAPVTEKITVAGVDGLYKRLLPNDVYKQFVEYETKFPEKLVSTTFWWILAVGVCDEAGRPVMYNRLQMAGSIPTLEEADTLKDAYAHPSARKVMDDIWEAIMQFNGFINAKEGADGKK